MSSAKRISITKFVAVVATTTLIFIFGILLGNYLSNIKLSSLDELQQDLRVKTMSLEMQYSLLAENPCAHTKTNTLNEELYQLNSKIDFMESSLGTSNTDVLRLKEYYSILQLRHYLLLRRAMKECGEDYIFVLYFYSNKEDCPDCRSEGDIITYFRKELENMRVYAFDIDIDNVAIETVKELYGVDAIPTMVINDQVFKGFLSKNEMQKVFANFSSVNNTHMQSNETTQ